MARVGLNNFSLSSSIDILHWYTVLNDIPLLALVYLLWFLTDSSIGSDLHLSCSDPVRTWNDKDKGGGTQFQI